MGDVKTSHLSNGRAVPKRHKTHLCAMDETEGTSVALDKHFTLPFFRHSNNICKKTLK